MWLHWNQKTGDYYLGGWGSSCCYTSWKTSMSWSPRKWKWPEIVLVCLINMNGQREMKIKTKGLAPGRRNFSKPFINRLLRLYLQMWMNSVGCSELFFSLRFLLHFIKKVIWYQLKLNWGWFIYMLKKGEHLRKN